MKKIITVIMYILIETCALILIVLMYQTQKQVLVANEIFDNTIESLRSRNFSAPAIQAVSSNKDYTFEIKQLQPDAYRVVMSYRLDYQKGNKTITSIVYRQL